MRFAAFVALTVGLLVGSASALETDQFTVPSRPLVDLGPTLDTQAAAKLAQVVAAANATRAKELAAMATSKTSAAKKLHREKSYAVVSQQNLAKAYYDAIAGDGVPVCKIEDWMLDERSGRYAVMQPMPVGDSVYGANPFERPFLLIELSPTLRLHDQYIGLDKVGHFFQQGHEYYHRYFEARCDGKSEAEATKIAVAGGVGQEHGFYGEAIIGIYSNGDLAANYCGFLFYRNLMEPVKVGSVTLEPMISWKDDKLVLADRVNGDLLKPFVTEHWNEAMNPCFYNGYWRGFVKDRIAGKVDQWMKFNHSTPQLEAARLQRVETFYGADYGHHDWRDVITLVNAGDRDTVASR